MKNRNILIIPHSPHMHIKVRSFEMAKCLAVSNNVSYLLWDEVNDFSLWSRMKDNLRSVFAGSDTDAREEGRCEEIDGVNVLRDVPKAYAPQWYASWRNGRVISDIIKRNEIDLVINAAFSLAPVRKHEGVEYAYDLVDDPFAESKTGKNNLRRKFIENEIRKADVVSACSISLSEYIKERWNQIAAFVPNGTGLREMREDKPDEILELKKRLGVDGKKVVGFISNFEPWNGLDFIANVFERIEKKRNDVSLVLVGSGRGLDAVRNRLAGMKSITVAGRVPPSEVATYFRMIDVGVLPFEKSDLTDRAFPIKVIEYGAARKHVVATPLEELNRHEFPNIQLVDRSVDKWVNAICEALEAPWNANWDSVYSEYDWTRVLNDKLAPHLRETGHSVEEPELHTGAISNCQAIREH